MRIGITGHTNLAAGARPAVADALRALIAAVGAPVVGVTCLARGADQLFARAVLDAGGEIVVVLPAADYRERVVGPDDRAVFDALLASAVEVRVMPFVTSDSSAYMAASEAVLDAVDRLVAVWDGRPAGGHGGTGDVVAAARERGVPVTVVWPSGARRDP